MAILSKVCKTDNLELHNSLKFSFMNIRGLRSNFDVLAFLQECQNICPDILLSVRQAWMTQLILAISLLELIFL